MQIAEIIDKKNNGKKTNGEELDLILEDLQNKISLNKKEEKTFKYYLKIFKKIKK